MRRAPDLSPGGMHATEKNPLEGKSPSAVAGGERLFARGRLPEAIRGSAAHQALFRQYVKDLEAAKEDAEDWWESLIDTEEERVGDRDQAVENVNERRPTGLMSLGASDAVVREYWLKCDALNQKTKDPEERVRARGISPSLARDRPAR